MIPLSRRQAQVLLLLGDAPQTAPALGTRFAATYPHDDLRVTSLANLLTWLKQIELARHVHGGFVVTDMGKFYWTEARDVLGPQGEVHAALLEPQDDRPAGPRRR